MNKIEETCSLKNGRLRKRSEAALFILRFFLGGGGGGGGGGRRILQN